MRSDSNTFRLASWLEFHEDYQARRQVDLVKSVSHEVFNYFTEGDA
jgi:hypothetical protein